MKDRTTTSWKDSEIEQGHAASEGASKTVEPFLEALRDKALDGLTFVLRPFFSKDERTSHVNNVSSSLSSSSNFVYHALKTMQSS